jgi:hypothetical protein
VDIIKQEYEEQPTIEHRGNQGREFGTVLRNLTGWTLLAASVGIFFDAITCGGCAQGSIGLIPLYIGFPIGSVGLVLITKKVAGWIPTLFAAFGVFGILLFMFSYPEGAEGWLGAIFIGIAHLFFPLSGRFASVLWVAVGILGFPEFGAASWGPVSAFTVFGAATAASGIFVLWGLKPIDSSKILE